MNKNVAFSFLTAMVLVALVACSGKKEGHQESESSTDSWKPMDDFHFLMAEAFHPYKDSANLKPAKSNADEMAESADAWAKAPLPEKVNNARVKEKLNLLARGTAEFTNIVKSNNDDEIAESLNDLHDLFHEIQEEWYGTHDHHHGHDHDHEGHHH